jgi:methionyl aminopeptidase
MSSMTSTLNDVQSARTFASADASGAPSPTVAKPTLRGREPFITLKTMDEIAMIRAAGDVVAAALAAAKAVCTPGASTMDLDEAAAQVIANAGATSLFLNYPSYRVGHGFPARTCVSVNDVVVHGIPGDRLLRDGDVVTVDCGVRLNGWCADSAITVGVGRVSDDRARMIETANAILLDAIASMRPGVSWHSIAGRMQGRTESAGYGVVREYFGHGIGRQLHEPPSVPAYCESSSSTMGRFTLRPGMVLAIEPMLTRGSPETYMQPDGWTVSTADGSVACHVEHTVAVTNDGPMILTDGRLTRN